MSFQSARLAWELIAPAADPPRGCSPLQFLLHARMTTSRFIYEMTKLLESRPSRHPVPTTNASVGKQRRQ